jgi:dethiobiotin synthetase
MAYRFQKGAYRNPVLPGSCFVSGLGADDGERIATLAVIRGLRALGLRVAAMTPMVLDGVSRAGHWTSERLDVLGREGSFALPGRALSPYVLPPAPTPADAAIRAGLHIKSEAVVETYQVLATWADAIVVEGVGGLAVRLGPSLAVLNVVRRLALPLVLAIHPDTEAPRRAAAALCSARKAGVRIAGWIATGMGSDRGSDRDSDVPGTLAILTAMMGGQPIAELPLHADSGQAAVRHVELSMLRGALAVEPVSWLTPPQHSD